jgi:hypothetical protein
VIQRVAPAVDSGQELVVAEGQQLALAVEATSAQPGPLQYVWLLDGQERARGPRWTYQPEFDEGGPRRKQMTVQVTDQANQRVEQSWQVRVQDVNRPPTVTVAFPEEKILEMKTTDTPRFAVQAVDPDTGDQLAYVWFLDGQEVGHGQSWDLIPSTTAAPSPHRVRVAVSDKAGMRVEEEWTVAVANAPPPLPTITWVTPTHQRLRVAEGQKLALAVEATSAQPGPLQYVWLLDGQERARGPRWTYQPEFDEGGPRRKQVTVQVTDQANQRVEQSWQVRVQDVNRPPLITAVFPSVDTIELAAGKEESFSVQATDPDTDDQLVSVWSLDGQEVARGQGWSFRAPSTLNVEIRHQVTVEVSDPDGLKNRFAWNIVVKKSSSQPYTAEANLLEVVSPSPPLFSETEVRIWLEAQRRAWQEKNVDALVELGVVASNRADRSRKILAQYQSFKVILQNVEIHVTPSHAQVSFSRIDVIDGETVPHPDRKVFILEKEANGHLTARQP